MNSERTQRLEKDKKGTLKIVFTVLASPRSVIAFGFGVFALYVGLGLFLVPLPGMGVDTTNWNHWAASNFAYASSAVDLSVISPFEGLGGLMQPLGVWLNPSDLLPHLLHSSTDSRVWGLIVASLLLALATFLLGRAMGLPYYLAIVSGQLVTMVSLPPMYLWTAHITRLNLAGLYVHCRPGIALCTVLGTSLVAVFAWLGKLSFKKNLACIIALPLLVLYSILCNPLYTAMFLVPIAFYLTGVFAGSLGSRQTLLWRAAGAGFCLVVCLLVNLHGFYRALFAYAARAVFPNELYVEVQQWDYLTNLVFQHGLATPFVVFVMVGCALTCVLGRAEIRGFAASVLAYQLIMIGVSLTYVYSGLRWNQPLPAYFEYGAFPAYVVAGFLGVWVGWTKLAAWFPYKALLTQHLALSPAIRLCLAYASVLALPLVGLAETMGEMNDRRAHGQPILANPQVSDTAPPVGIVKYLRDELALPQDGLFRGSVTSIAGVPGGGLMNHLGVPESAPFDKNHIGVIGGYFRGFDPNFFMTGLWNLRIPTLEDNNHLVTPPFHFLLSRALSRPQDFHSRNWAMITKADPKLMAALGSRFLLADKPLQDPLLTLRTEQANGEGVTVYAYEIAGANTGALSPTRTVLSGSAIETIALMTSPSFAFNETAVVHGENLNGLTPAEAGTINFKKGGVRVRGRSHGPALLVLPVQFSNSLQIVTTRTNSKRVPIKLLRVNLLETGVLFDGEIDMRIAHVFGPFRGVQGRLRDVEDCKRLGITETGEIPYPPHYQPLAKMRPTAYPCEK
ncbi:MAG: hypothetical protein QOD12_2490 [Verrucomicrobiota bacterium]|jgi:hypothetical protein